MIQQMKNKKFNSEEIGCQLTLDLKLDLNSYLNSIIKQNELDIMHIVQEFMKDYSYLESRRLRSFGVRGFGKLALDYDPHNLIILNLDGYKIPVGYEQELRFISQSVAIKSIKQNKHFYCEVKDPILYIRINADYLAFIKSKIKSLLLG